MMMMGDHGLLVDDDVLDAGKGILQGSEATVQRAAGDEEARHTGWSCPSKEAAEQPGEDIHEV